MRSATSGAPVPDRRGRPRQRPADVGRAGRDKPTLGGSSTRGRGRALRPDHPCRADAADWIADVVATCPNAVRCGTRSTSWWATEALDEVRRQAWNDARGWPAPPRRAGGRSRRDAAARPRPSSAPATHCGRTRRTSPTASRQAGLDRQDRPRLLPRLPAQGGPPYWSSNGPRRPKPRRWTGGWPGPAAAASPSFVDPHGRIVETPGLDRRHPRDGLSNALIESTNTKIRLFTRIAFGFASPTPLIALAMLALGGFRPPLPGRTDPRISQESQIGVRSVALLGLGLAAELSDYLISVGIALPGGGH